MEYLGTLPPRATVCVRPDGAMINYLSRRNNPADAARTELEWIAQMDQTPADYVIIGPRNLVEEGITHFGAPGEPGFPTVQWLQKNNYVVATGQGGDPFNSKSRKGVLILRREPKPATRPSPKPAAAPAPKSE